MTYKEYKKVNLPWLDEVPEHWGIKRIASVLNIRKEINNPIKTEEVLSLSAKYGVTLYAEKKEKGGNKPKSDLTKYNICHKGDILVNCMNVVAGAVGISNYFGAVSPVYYPLITNKYNDKYYMEYLFRNYNFQRGMVGLGKGIMMNESENGNLTTIRMRISWDTLKTLEIPVPPKEEQEQIARFLDWKIKDIDSLIEKKKSKIESFKNLKGIFLDYNFGKVINTGDFQTHENCESYVKIKYLTKTITKKSRENERFIGLENIPSKSGKMSSSYSELQLNKEGIIVEKGMVIFAKLRPYLAKVYLVEENVTCSSEFLVLDCGESISNEFLKYIMLSPIFIDLVDSSTYGSKMPRANSDFIVSIEIKEIPIDEQLTLVKKANLFFLKIEKFISNLEKQIQKLKLLKDALISDVVSGKIDIRNIEIPDYKKNYKNIDKLDD